MINRKTALLVASATLALAGCWSDNDEDTNVISPPPPPPVVTAVPDSAVATSASFASYVKGLSLTDETTEPLTLPTVVAFTSETEEPQTL